MRTPRRAPSPPRSTAWPACTSALRLDRWLAGELSQDAADAIAAHVASCDRCRAAVASLQAGRQAAVLPPLKPGDVPARAPARGWRWRPWAAAMLLAVAAAVLLARAACDGRDRPRAAVAPRPTRPASSAPPSGPG